MRYILPFFILVSLSCDSNKLAKVNSSNNDKNLLAEAEARATEAEARNDEEAERLRKEAEDLRSELDAIKEAGKEGNDTEGADGGEEEADGSDTDLSGNQNRCSTVEGGSWILVPGDLDYGTKDFCVMKYEAKCSLAEGQNCTDSMSTEMPISSASNTPWVPIIQQDAIAKCASLGSGYHLLTNNEWMTIGSNLVHVASNWSSDPSVVGNGQLIRGHSDGSPAEACAASSDDTLNIVNIDCTPQTSVNVEFIEQRTHTLSNGEVIWDISGNVWEWTSYLNTGEKPTLVGENWEFTEVTGTYTIRISDLLPQIAIINSWNSNQSIGRYYPGDGPSGGALLRGGGWGDKTYAGVFATRLDNSATSMNAGLGFRCAFDIP